MWLVLCDDGDRSAQWVHEGLRARGVYAELVTAGMLARAPRWVHSVGAAGAAGEVLLPDGRLLQLDAVEGVLNRLVGLRLPGAFLASPDREYALQEIFALYLSVLQCLRGPVLNRPSPQGLSGRARSVPEWLMLAGAAGFATAPLTVSSHTAPGRGDAIEEMHPDAGLAPGTVSGLEGASHQSVIVAAGEVFGADLSRAALEAARRLAALAEVELLGLRVAITAQGECWFEAADLYPDLDIGGDSLLDHLAAVPSGWGTS